MAIIVLLGNFRIKTLFSFFFFFLVLHPLFILCSSPLLTIVKKKASKLIAHPHLSSFDIVIFHSKNLTSILPVTQKQNKTKQNI
jgi:Na+/H+-dicarboxylate symporter